MSKKKFSKGQAALGIGLTFGVVVGAVIGSRTGDMKLWISLGLLFGTSVGLLCCSFCSDN